MRLHHLEITAFGPFAGTVGVDFDVLSEAGLFLLSGATGSGKTSVLDAVCFALYGDVPGDRGSAKRLRADQADAGVASQVVLETTLSGRRFRIVRAPARERPKRRGTGTTMQHASVSIAELVDDTWQTLSTRLDETGHLVGGLVGMNLDQFCQVAMLPQGRFQTFLRARSEDRHRLLQVLFRTGRFEAVERWLRDHRLALRGASTKHHAAVASLVSRISEAADTEVGDWDTGALDSPAGAGQIETWADALTASASEAVGRAEVEDATARTAATTSQSALDEGRRLVERQSRHAAARVELDRLAAGAEAHRDAVAGLEQAGRAERVLPLADITDQARAAAQRSAEVAQTALVRLTGLGVDTGRDNLARARDEARDQAAAARALVPRECRLSDLRGTLAAHAASVARLDQEIVQHVATLDRFPARTATSKSHHEAAVTAVAALPGAEAGVRDLQRRAGAVASLTALRPQLEAAREAHSRAVDEAQQQAEVWLTLRERRLDGMAAEIAVGLVVGGCCPVCGSADHPQPAQSLAGAPDAEAERQARKGVDDAESARHVHDQHVRDVLTRIALAEQLAGPDADGLVSRVTAAEAELAELRAAAGAEPLLAAALRRLDAESTDIARRRDTALLERARVLSAERTERAEVAAITAEVQAALSGTEDPDLSSLADRLAAVTDACERAVAARAEHERCATGLARAEATLGAALVDAGFADVDAARAARVDPDEVGRLTRQVRARDAAVMAARTTTTDPELTAAVALPVPDLDALRVDAERTRERAASATARARVTSARCTRLAALHDELVTALRSWEPVRHDLALATELSAFADGKSPANRLQMRLSAYVLAYRLAQVVDAANERLSTMSDQRYSLAHSGRRGAGETRGGLSLLVRDDWSGETRDPATLSGGETFVVSLALALGLADVITQESDPGAAGDSRLDTLFVDEGFGSLDADTLDDVMDTLDSLREGGRVVGVVSHVAEMRDRIPTRLEVTKSRRGSTLSGPGDALGSTS